MKKAILSILVVGVLLVLSTFAGFIGLAFYPIMAFFFVKLAFMERPALRTQEEQEETAVDQHAATHDVLTGGVFSAQESWPE